MSAQENASINASKVQDVLVKRDLENVTVDKKYGSNIKVAEFKKEMLGEEGTKNDLGILGTNFEVVKEFVKIYSKILEDRSLLEAIKGNVISVNGIKVNEIFGTPISFKPYNPLDGKELSKAYELLKEKHEPFEGLLKKIFTNPFIGIKDHDKKNPFFKSTSIYTPIDYSKAIQTGGKWKSVDNEETELYFQKFMPTEAEDATSEQVNKYLKKCADIQKFYVIKHTEYLKLFYFLKELIGVNYDLTQSILALTKLNVYDESGEIDTDLNLQIKPIIKRIDILLKNQAAIDKKVQKGVPKLEKAYLEKAKKGKAAKVVRKARKAEERAAKKAAAKAKARDGAAAGLGEAGEAAAASEGVLNFSANVNVNNDDAAAAREGAAVVNPTYDGLPKKYDGLPTSNVNMENPAYGILTTPSAAATTESPREREPDDEYLMIGDETGAADTAESPAADAGDAAADTAGTGGTGGTEPAATGPDEEEAYINVVPPAEADEGAADTAGDAAAEEEEEEEGAAQGGGARKRSKKRRQNRKTLRGGDNKWTSTNKSNNRSLYFKHGTKKIKGSTVIQSILNKCSNLELLYLVKHYEVLEIMKPIIYFLDTLTKNYVLLLYIITLYTNKPGLLMDKPKDFEIKYSKFITNLSKLVDTQKDITGFLKDELIGNTNTTQAGGAGGDGGAGSPPPEGGEGEGEAAEEEEEEAEAEVKAAEEEGEAKAEGEGEPTEAAAAKKKAKAEAKAAKKAEAKAKAEAIATAQREYGKNLVKGEKNRAANFSKTLPTKTFDNIDVQLEKLADSFYDKLSDEDALKIGYDEKFIKFALILRMKKLLRVVIDSDLSEDVKEKRVDTILTEIERRINSRKKEELNKVLKLDDFVDIDSPFTSNDVDSILNTDAEVGTKATYFKKLKNSLNSHKLRNNLSSLQASIDISQLQKGGGLFQKPKKGLAIKKAESWRNINLNQLRQKLKPETTVETPAEPGNGAGAGNNTYMDVATSAAAGPGNNTYMDVATSAAAAGPGNNTYMDVATSAAAAAGEAAQQSQNYFNRIRAQAADAASGYMDVKGGGARKRSRKRRQDKKAQTKRNRKNTRKRNLRNRKRNSSKTQKRK